MPQIRYKKHLDEPAYKAYKQMLSEDVYECWETGCVNRAVTPDHCPPISTYADPSQWRGTFKPHCRYHSNKQGALMRWGRKIPNSSREW